MPKAKKTTTIVNPWEHLKRFYEIALLGGFKVVPISDEPIFEDFNTFAKSVIGDIFASEGELYIELPPIKRDYLAEYIFTPEVSFEGCVERVEAAKRNPKPTQFDNPYTHETLMATAQRRMNLSETALLSVKEVASVIAQLDGSKKIELVHTAEAINYHIFVEYSQGSFTYNLMEPEYMLIKGVKIPVTFKDPANAYELDELISELQKLKG